MSLLAHWDTLLYESSLAGAPLLRAMLHGTLFVLLIGVICRLLPRMSASARCWLWWLACLKLLLGLFWVTPVSLPVLPAPVTVSAGQPGTVPLDPAYVARPRANTDVQASPAESSGTGEATPSEETESGVGMAIFLLALSLLWFIGVLFRVGVSVWQYATVTAVIAHAHPLQNSWLESDIREISTTLNLRRTPRLRSTVIQTDPLAAGVLRPVVVLSTADQGRLSPAELRQVLAHELGHLRRGDLWLGLIPLFTQIVFWFFPPALYAVREYEIAREAAADALALATTRTVGHDYGRLLLKMSATAESPYYGAAALSVTSHFRQLERRIVMLQIHPSPKTRPLLRGAVTTAVLVAAGGLVPWRMIAAQAGVEAAPGPRNLSFESGIAPWVRSASEASDKFEARVDSSSPAHNGKTSLLIDIPQDIPGEAFVKQKFNAKAFAGKSVQFSAYLRSENLKKYGAGIWVRVDGSNYQKAWNKLSNVVQETKGWTKAEYDFPVPADAKAIEVGVSVAGTGKVWMDDVQFEAAPAGVKLVLMEPDFDTEQGDGGGIAVVPRNLDFAEGIRGWGNTANGVDDSPNPYYTVGVDTTVRYNDKPSGFLMATVEKPQGYGALRQDISARNYRGKRIRYSGFIKTVGTSDLASPLLFISTPTQELNFAQEKDSLRGDTDWKPFEFVGDVPEDASMLMIGLSIRGKGKIYISGAKLEVVGKEVPVSSKPSVAQSSLDLPKAPSNLNFAQGLESWGKQNPEGDAPDYAIQVTAKAGRNGGPAASLAAVSNTPHSYGTLLQYFSPDAFRGKRIRYSAYLRTEKAQAGEMWLRLDTDGIGQGGGGWNMEEKPIKGTTSWKRYECVIDVPKETIGIQFGLSLTGTGKIWTDGFQFEIVGKDTPLTPGVVLPR